MKLIILKDNFKKGLSCVERIVADNTSLPILKNILIKIIDNKIKISATNLELGIEKFISGKILEDGSLTVPFLILNNIISNTDSDRINIEKEGDNIIIKTDNYKAKIQGIQEDEYPIIPKIKNKEKNIEINTDIVKNAFLEIINAAQFSEIRPEISGVLFDFQSTVFKLVATDSFRLAEKTIYDHQFKTNFNQGFKVIIPLKTAQEIIKIFPDDVSMKIYIDENQILFENEDQKLISRLIEGQYPDYEQIIPKTTETEIILSKEKIKNAVKLVSSLSGKINDIKLSIKNNSKTVEVYSSNNQLGENNYLIPAKIKGPEFDKITFNWRYLLDAIKPIKTENIFMGVNGDNKPTIIKSPEESSYFYILMPIKNN